eukprot:scaffold29499_cov60-Phaeocystis_antarctica.AAC.5
MHDDDATTDATAAAAHAAAAVATATTTKHVPARRQAALPPYSRPQASADSPHLRQTKLRAGAGGSSLYPASASLGQPRPASASLGQPRPASASLGQPRPASVSLGQYANAIGRHILVGLPWRASFPQSERLARRMRRCLAHLLARRRAAAHRVRRRLATPRETKPELARTTALNVDTPIRLRTQERHCTWCQLGMLTALYLSRLLHVLYSLYACSTPPEWIWAASPIWKARSPAPNWT